MSETSLASLHLPGIGPARARRLEEAGVRTVGELLKLGADGLAALLGMSASQAERALDAASQVQPAVVAQPAVEAEPAPREELPFSVQLDAVEPTEPEIATGLVGDGGASGGGALELAGAPVEEVTVEVVVNPAPADDLTIEAEPVGDSTEPGPVSDDLIARLKNAAAMVSGAVAVVGGGEPGRVRKRALRSLKKLRKAAETLADRLAVTAPSDELTAATIDLLDALEPRLLRLCARSPTRRRLRRTRVWARALRRALRELMA